MNIEDKVQLVGGILGLQDVDSVHRFSVIRDYVFVSSDNKERTIGPARDRPSFDVYGINPWPDLNNMTEAEAFEHLLDIVLRDKGQL
jgi:hypothetical protein